MSKSRRLEERIRESAKLARIISLVGPRQCGKTTLTKLLVKEGVFKKYITFDDLSELDLAQTNPQSYARALSFGTVIDEVQRVPEILLAIKVLVDNTNKAGHLLLTGSSNVFSMPYVSESLAGRINIKTLYPFSVGEKFGTIEKFIEDLFLKSRISEPSKPSPKVNISEEIDKGGFPEVCLKYRGNSRNEWFKSYIESLIYKDAREISNIDGLKHLPLILKLLSERIATPFNASNLAREAGVPLTTLNRYLTLLEALYLITFLKPWFSNKSKRLVKSPKPYFLDTGVMGYLRGNSYQKENPKAAGHCFENFIILEILKQISFSKLNINPYYYRTQKGVEVDLILEHQNDLVAIEIKSAEEINSDDLKGILEFQQLGGKKFSKGLILYQGKEFREIYPNIYKVPVNYLWSA